MPDLGDAMRRAGMDLPKGRSEGRGGDNVTGSQTKCVECGRMFTPAQPHHRKCPECFRGGGRVPSGERDRPRQEAGLPAGYLTGGYFDEARRFRRELVTDVAEEVGQLFARNDLTSGQIRRFFGHARQIEYQMKSGRSFEEVEVEFAKLASAAADAFSKSGGGREKKIPPVFYEFVRRNVDMVRSRRDFDKGFLPHFEAVLGFFNFYEKSKRGGRR